MFVQWRQAGVLPSASCHMYEDCRDCVVSRCDPIRNIHFSALLKIPPVRILTIPILSGMAYKKNFNVGKISKIFSWITIWILVVPLLVKWVRTVCERLEFPCQLCGSWQAPTRAFYTVINAQRKMPWGNSFLRYFSVQKVLVSWEHYESDEEICNGDGGSKIKQTLFPWHLATVWQAQSCQ